jgi:hypothetical protein
MIHDNTGRASTACHYSPSLVAAEEQAVRGSSVSLKGEKALLEFLLDMVASFSPPLFLSCAQQLLIIARCFV